MKSHGIIASMKRVAREGSIAVVALVSFVGAPAIAAASPVGPVSRSSSPMPAPRSSSSPAASSAGASSSSSTSSSSSSSSSSGGLKQEILIGAGFAAMWLAGIPFGPGKVIPMPTGERLIKGLGGIGMIAAAVMALAFGFGSGFSLLGVGAIIGGLGLLAFGLHFGLSALWGKTKDGTQIASHGTNGNGTSSGSGLPGNGGNGTGRPVNTTGSRVPSDGTAGHVGRLPGVGGNNAIRSANTRAGGRSVSATGLGTGSSSARSGLRR
jgi:hypothetical protein